MSRGAPGGPEARRTLTDRAYHNDHYRPVYAGRRMFSSRLPRSLAPNALTEAMTRLQVAGVSWVDLTETNPTAVGFDYPQNLLNPLADSRATRYQPEALGLIVTREAIARDYARRGRRVSPSHVVVTASTSEAYSVLFKLLCNPGDSVLVPQPSYPLFELLAGLEAVTLRPYQLVDHDGWSIDRDTLTAAMTPTTRAILVVSPNNPTGSLLRQADLDWLAQLCNRRSLALVIDEVFADYPISPRPDAAALTGLEPALTFALGGLSKSAGLPQVKLGWMAVAGPDALVSASLHSLELICDTYLSVGTPVQLAAPVFIETGAMLRDQIRARVHRNLGALRETLRRQPAMTLQEPEGGWSAVWQVPAIESEEALVLRFLTTAHVLIHPGYFFDFPREAFLVASLLPRPEVFDEGVGRLVSAMSGAVG